MVILGVSGSCFVNSISVNQLLFSDQRSYGSNAVMRTVCRSSWSQMPRRSFASQVIESPVFTITGDQATFWLGGDAGSPSDPAAWLALYSEDGKEVRRAVPDSSRAMAQQWELLDLVGQQHLHKAIF